MDARGYDVIAVPPGSAPAKSDGALVVLFTTEENRDAVVAVAAEAAAAKG